MTSSDASPAIRVAVLGEWVPSQLADVLALQRAEEPETTAALVECAAGTPVSEASGGGFDFALSTADVDWPGWVREPLWQDTLAVAVAKRSHLLAYREVPSQEALKQPLIYAQSTVGEAWHSIVRQLLEVESHACEQATASLAIAMTLVSAGYGISIAPAGRLASHLHRGIATRPLAGAPSIVTTYLLWPGTDLPESQSRFIRRVRSVK